MASKHNRHAKSDSRLPRLTVGPRPDLAMLFDETVALYLHLSATSAALYRLGDISGPRRTVLTALARSGPQTVASLARSRAQSRQRLQPLVDALLRDGLIVRHDNPAHKRAYLIALTRRGKAVVRHVLKTEGALRAQLRIDISKRRIEDAATVLRAVRTAVETQTLASLNRGHRDASPRSSIRTR
jgi:DNA-binding MarR family transcriptional regulator